uniref:NADH-ubiquinone oxidoreductase chain 4 n=1 Tax=Idgia oculata TaxID=1404354 RepID=A0A5J6CG77_9CUCU|nr:NADH dehydrogenase subunit 4 [Idgia oculata]QEQ14408.1 NADH dehydrogenase subunit 4 [Idgia oculata]
MTSLVYLMFMIPLSLKKLFWTFQIFLLYLMFNLFKQMSFDFEYTEISYNLGLDYLSYSMMLLSIIISFLMGLASEKLFKDNFFFKLFNFLNLILLASFMVLFCSLNLFIFYLFFEISLIPVLLMILGWGNQPERIQAGLYLLFYTLLASLPMMISIFYMYKMNLSLEFYFFQFFFIDNVFMFFCMNFVFFIKMPMYFVHLWLPKAHVEAPVAGSMVLAGVMLKLGGYGLMRLMLTFMKITSKINLIFITLSLIGGVLISMICITQNDLKSLIAYSSVAHMGLVLSGILIMNYWGMLGSLILMIAHGLCSSGLFSLSNLNYERLMSRSIYLNKGLLGILPSLSLWWFLFCAFNMAAPPSMNLLGEIMLVTSVVSYSKFTMIMLMFISFFSAVYSLYLFSYTQHGSIMESIRNINLVFLREFLLLIIHLLPLIFLIIKSEFISIWI